MRLFGLEIGSVGLTETQAKDANLDVIAMQVKYPSLPHYFEGGEEVPVRMIAEKQTGKILGAQILCREAAALRVNLISTAILAGVTVSQFADSDFCYSPPCSDIWAPEAIAAQTIMRRLKRS
ncbi:MAG: hypothetical protein N2234_08605 [Planctomycetota bacterium]|nr:hypothetical protein [Planctomycetota bacterium]